MGYMCRECGYEPTERELRSGVCPDCREARLEEEDRTSPNYPLNYLVYYKTREGDYDSRTYRNVRTTKYLNQILYQDRKEEGLYPVLICWELAVPKYVYPGKHPTFPFTQPSR